MANVFYKIVSQAGRNLRKSHYDFYRSLVDNKIFQKIISFSFGGRFIKIKTPEGFYMFLNPIYHGFVLNEDEVYKYELNLRKLFNNILKPGMITYDIGANIGIFSLLFIDKVGPDGGAYAFEPEENNYACLVKTKNFNKMSNLYINPVCVAESSGAKLFDRRGGASSGRIVETDNIDKRHNFSLKASVSIDDFIFKENNPAPDLVKIDVEGNEYRAINGMMKTLEKYKPYIVCELHKDLCPKIDEIFLKLNMFGYKCYDLNDYMIGKGEALTQKSFNNSSQIFAIV